MRILSMLIIVGLTCLSLNQAQADQYLSGQQTYAGMQSKLPGWQFLEVPFDYSQPDGQKTSISYKLSDNFSKDKNTVIFFAGGPGGSVIPFNFAYDTDVNFILFDARGIGFSKPETQAMYLNPDYYSSENMARDALEIAKHLGIDKVTAYGQSYGTVPATIFGHLFPEHTRSVILDGTMLDGDRDTWSTPYVVAQVQKVFDQLPQNEQETVLKYSNDPRVFGGWFFMQAINDETTYILPKDLTDLFGTTYPISADQDQKIVSNLQANDGLYDVSQSPDALEFSTTVARIVECKELGGLEGYADVNVFFQGTQLVWQPDDTHHCAAIGITKDHLYHATDYPLSVPTYYFQGTTDPLTPIDRTLMHYNQVPQAGAQFVTMQNVGHGAILRCLVYFMDLDNPSAPGPTPTPLVAPALILFNTAVAGQKITDDEIAATNKAAPANKQWSLQSK